MLRNMAEALLSAQAETHRVNQHHATPSDVPLTPLGVSGALGEVAASLVGLVAQAVMD